MIKICFFGNLSLAFAKRDYEILKKHFDVEVIEPPKSKSDWVKYPLVNAKKVKKCDITFSWFAGWHSVCAVHYSKKYKKKSIVVAGGFDVVHLPEINYGAFDNLKEKLPSKYTLKHANVVISVSKSNQQELLEKIQPKKNVVIYNGVPIENFPRGTMKKEMMAITVGGIKWSNLKRKGIEPFIKTAKYLPDVPFIIIGKPVDDSIDYLKSIAPSNVKFTGYVQKNELLQYLQKAKVYVQPSFHEGFGVSVAEAMLCECIPVVTKRFALPEVVGDTGYYVPFDDAEKTALAIKNALNSPQKSGFKARKRIIENFSLKYREEKLVELIKLEGVY
jgi:glycosyltransferase involved in cell wall biosynthesis